VFYFWTRKQYYTTPYTHILFFEKFYIDQNGNCVKTKFYLMTYGNRTYLFLMQA